MYNTKNYMSQGGDELHIGGKLIIDKGGSVEGFDGGGSSYALPDAGPDTRGGVKQAAHVADAVEAADETVTKAEFDAVVGVINSLLANMTAAGQMAAE